MRHERWRNKCNMCAKGVFSWGLLRHNVLDKRVAFVNQLCSQLRSSLGHVRLQPCFVFCGRSRMRPGQVLFFSFFLSFLPSHMCRQLHCTAGRSRATCRARCASCADPWNRFPKEAPVSALGAKRTCTGCSSAAQNCRREAVFSPA